MKNMNFCFDTSWSLRVCQVFGTRTWGLPEPCNPVPGPGPQISIAYTYTHTCRGLTQELAAVLGLQTSTGSCLSSCWLQRCPDPPNSQFPIPVNTWSSTYTCVCRIETRTHLALWKVFRSRIKKKGRMDGWWDAEHGQASVSYRSVALSLFLLSWPMLFFCMVP